MTFALTKYIYPLEKEITLSESMHFILDNPRTDEEIKIIKDYISNTLKEYEFEPIVDTPNLAHRVWDSIFSLRKYLREKEKDCYAIKYYDANKEKKIIDILSETWIIIRFNDDEIFDKISKDKSELFRLILTSTETDYSRNFKDLSSYCHLVSLLTNEEPDYHGSSFLMSKDPYALFFSENDRQIIETLDEYIGYNHAFRTEKQIKDWLHWLDGFENLINGATKLEIFLIQDRFSEKGKKISLSQKQTPKQKLLHVGNLLKTSFDHLQDPELMLLLLVSIIEYLVTSVMLIVN